MSSLISHYFSIYIFGGFVWLFLNLTEHFVKSKNAPWLWHMLLSSILESSSSSFRFHFGIIVPPRALSYIIHCTLFLSSQWHLRHCMWFIRFTSMCYLNISSVKLRAVLVTSVFLSPSIHMPPRAVIKCGPWWPLTLPPTIVLLAPYASELMTLLLLIKHAKKVPFSGTTVSLPGMAYLRVTEATPSQVSNQISPTLPFFNYLSLSSPLLGFSFGHRIYCHLTLSVCWFMSPLSTLPLLH